MVGLVDMRPAVSTDIVVPSGMTRPGCNNVARPGVADSMSMAMALRTCSRSVPLGVRPAKRMRWISSRMPGSIALAGTAEPSIPASGLPSI